MSSQNLPQFEKQRHMRYWKHCSTLLPVDYTSGDASRMLLAFFIVASLDLLDSLESVISQEEKQSWIEWVYSCQVHSGGFRGFTGTKLGDMRTQYNWHWDPANLPNTYFALAILLILGDDLGRVRRKECLNWVRKLQRPNGSFGEFLGEDDRIEGQDDLRQCCCAAGICYILQAGMEDLQKPFFQENELVRFIGQSQSHDGGFGQAPFLESHSGMSYCAFTALSFLRLLREVSHSPTVTAFDRSINVTSGIAWIIDRQTARIEDDEVGDEDEDEDEQDDDGEELDEENKRPNKQNLDTGWGETLPSMSPLNAVLDDLASPTAGFNGRIGKIADTCYCFWNVGTLKICQKDGLVDFTAMRRYLIERVQHRVGGFAKSPGEPPDILHSFFGLAALALCNESGLQPLNATLCMSERAAGRLPNVAWRKN